MTKRTLLFDSGATKCDSIILSPEGTYINHVTDTGINATYMEESMIQQILHHIAEQLQETDFQYIIFYGAGCGNQLLANKIQKCLTQVFTANTYHICSDLLGACHFLCQQEAGNVAILGTGASACFYDGKKIAIQVPSLGFWLGDEGSGVYLGKKLLISYLKNNLSQPIQQEMEERFQVDRNRILENIYRHPSAHRYMSSFCSFLREKQQDPCIHHLLYQAFQDFFDQQIAYLPTHLQYPLHLMGSIAYHFLPIIQEIADKEQLSIGHCISSPLQFIRENGYSFINFQ